MTINGVCHTMWEDTDAIHLCGKPADHEWLHLCACGAVLLRGTSSLTDEQRQLREQDCPVCLARSGRPCHTKEGTVMSGVHTERAG